MSLPFLPAPDTFRAREFGSEGWAQPPGSPSGGDLGKHLGGPKSLLQSLLPRLLLADPFRDTIELPTGVCA